MSNTSPLHLHLALASSHISRIKSFSPHHVKILFLERRSLLPLSELARPEEKLVGLRIDGSYNARSRMSFYPGLGIHSLLDVGTFGPEKKVRGFPDGAKINFVGCVRKGKWAINWRPDKPSTLYWVETQDGGDAKVEPSPCYIVYVEPVQPAHGEEHEVFHTEIFVLE